MNLCACRFFFFFFLLFFLSVLIILMMIVLLVTADHELDSQPYQYTSTNNMVITYSKGKDQPGKIANSARVQLNRENEYFPVRVVRA